MQGLLDIGTSPETNTTLIQGDVGECITKFIASLPAKNRDLEFTRLTLKTWERCWKDVGMAPILPLLFNLKGKPFSLKDHTPMEPLYKLHNVPRRRLTKAGRQVAKSTTLAHAGTALSALIPYFNTLFMTPLFEQVRRFSQNYVRPALTNCVLRQYLGSSGSTDSVLQRTLPNGSTMFFTFAFLDCERARGINSDALKIDEYQGMDKSFLPVLIETMSASPYRIVELSGTPMTMDNSMEEAWQESSQAEWAITCRHCKKTNLAGYNFDLMKMIGKWNPIYKTGLVCAKCGKPISTRDGRWLHTRPHLRHIFDGLHTPQIIFPMHCEEEERWGELLLKKEKNEYSFMTEVCGESWDTGARLVTLTQLQAACTLPWRNTVEDALRHIELNRYPMRIVAVDWSGGGSKEESMTAMAVLGITPEGPIDCLYGCVMPHRVDYSVDARQVMQLFQAFGCHYVAHDYAGAGAGREQMLVHSGFPLSKILPVQYVRASGQKALVTFKDQTADNVRSAYSLDKARSCVFSCELIKRGYIRFPRWRTIEPCLRHFLGLVEETLVTPRSSDVFLIGKAQGVSDDFAHAINMGACMHYYLQQRWPDISKDVKRQKRGALREADPEMVRSARDA